MKQSKTFLTIILTIASCVTLGAELPAESRTALPSVLYMLPGSRTDLFTQAYVSTAVPAPVFVRVSGNCGFERRIPSVTTVVNPEDGMVMRVDVVDALSFDTVATDAITLRVARPRVAEPEVTVQIIGDSYVQGSFYRTALVDSANVPGIHMVGLRALTDADSQYDEGRGGWTLRDYFTISKGEFTPYSGFMQPDDDRRYLGACKFWINCHRVNNGELTDFESRYQCGRFGGCLRRFDAATGLPTAPRKNDLMWDGDKQCYICYDGKRWRECRDEDESKWSFNYSKYLGIWQIQAPDFLFETLGLNDWRDSLDADYGEWDEMLCRMKDSYLKANPEGKFAVVIPCSSCGSMYNRRGDFTARQNECMWRFRRHLVKRFDNCSDEGIYLVDMGITIDNENGYRVDGEGLQTGNPHPYPNYPAMGMPLAAFIQYHRK